MSCETLQHPSSYLLWMVLVSYLFFVGQILYQTRWKQVDTQSAVALISLMVVFLFCGLAHFTGLFGNVFHGKRELIYQVLIMVHMALVCTNKAGVMSRMMEHNDDPEIRVQNSAH